MVLLHRIFKFIGRDNVTALTGFWFVCLPHLLSLHDLLSVLFFINFYGLFFNFIADGQGMFNDT